MSAYFLSWKYRYVEHLPTKTPQGSVLTPGVETMGTLSTVLTVLAAQRTFLPIRIELGNLHSTTKSVVQEHSAYSLRACAPCLSAWQTESCWYFASHGLIE